MAERRGGRREGAGRPPSPKPLRTLSVRLDAEQIAWLRELGDGNASAGVRRLADLFLIRKERLARLEAERES